MGVTRRHWAVLRSLQEEVLDAVAQRERADHDLAEIERDLQRISDERRELRKRMDRARGQLNAQLGGAITRLIRRGRSPESIALAAGIDVDQLWSILSGTCSIGDDRLRCAAKEIVNPQSLLGKDQLDLLLNQIAEISDESAARSRWSQDARNRKLLFIDKRAAADQRVRIAEERLRVAAADSEQTPQRASAPRVEAVPDVEGHECKPDPLAARSEAEFVALLQRYRAWAGNPGFREMAQQVPDGPCYSTYSNVLRATTAPRKFKTVQAFVKALGGTDEDVRRWATAWRRVTATAEMADQTAAQNQGRERLTLLHGELAHAEKCLCGSPWEPVEHRACGGAEPGP